MALLTQPLHVGSLRLRNRLVMPPMATEKSEEGGKIGQALCDYYHEKTRGGYFGLVIAEHSYISPEGQASKGQVSLACDDQIEGLVELVDTIHRNGSKVFAQINHAGGKALPAITGHTALAPSAMDYTTTRGEAVQAQTMTQADIDKVIADFAAAARRVQIAGFDGVEIHSAHGYLLNQFYSPLTNKRTDAYTGTTMEGRTLLHRQVLAAVRHVVGPTYPVAVRLGACDYMPGGSTVADGARAARILQQAGADLIDISGGHCGYKGTGSKEEGYFGDASRAVKEAVDVPVVVTGGIVSAEGAESVLAHGKADAVGVGRAVLRDSSWAQQTIEKCGGEAIKGTVFFDYDGTLHNSMAIYGPAFRKAYAWLVDEGHMPAQGFSDEWISQWLGFTTEAMWTTFASHLPEEVWRAAAAIVGDEMDRRTTEGRAQLFDGIPEMLTRLKQQGYELVFLSNCRTAYCEVHRRMFDLDQWFDEYCSAEAFNDIPKWQIYQQVAGKHPYPQVVVGDRFHDVEVATRAGVPSVGCAYGFGRKDELDQATALVQSPADIPDAVASVLSAEGQRVADHE